MVTRTVERRRSVVKAITYRIAIMSLDFVTIYLFTGVVYLLHERIWAGIQWGIEEA